MSEGLGIAKQNLVSNIVTTNWKVETPHLKTFSYNELLFVIQELLTEEGKVYFESKTSQRGYEIFEMFVKHLLYRNIANYDSMVLITAEKGAGKSSAAIMIARAWCKLLGIKFNPQRHIAYNNADMMSKIDALNKFEPIIADEAVRFATSEDWAKKENKELKKRLAQIRTKHLLFLLCFPLKIYKVDKTYLESFTNYWIDLFARGRGIVYVKDRNPVMDSWRMKEFGNIGSYNEFTPVNLIRDKLKKHPNFWQVVRIPKPPEWLYNKYLKTRERNVYDDDNVLMNVSKEDIHKALLILTLRDIMVNDITFTMNRIILHIRNEYDLSLPKHTVQAAIEDCKQLVQKVKEQALEV